MKYKFILVTTSPRRIELLRKLNIKFDVIPPKVVKEKYKGNNPCDIVICNAINKINSVDEEYKDKDTILIAADTLIELNGKIIGKPQNREDAIRILKTLSGKWHNVYTGIAIKVGEKMYTDCCITKVKLKELSMEEIEFYIETREPLDAAGAYKIQGIGTIFIEEIHGSYDNVVGLPLNRLYMLLKKAGIDLIKIISGQ